MNNKQRSEFEKWMMSEGVKHVVADTLVLNGEYVFPETKILYLCWQAAIASVVVKLPTPIIDEYDNGETLEYVELSELKESLTKAGIRYE